MARACVCCYDSDSGRQRFMRDAVAEERVADAKIAPCLPKNEGLAAGLRARAL